MIGSIVSGILVTADKKGRVRSTNGKFISFWRGFGFFVLDLIICSLLVTLASTAVQNILLQNIRYIMAITSGMFLVFLVWFCHSFSYNPKKHWLAFTILILIIIGNILIVYWQNGST
jgi:DMSO/TMAO reductase YedYZ heme-binding membrane subunit